MAVPFSTEAEDVIHRELQVKQDVVHFNNKEWQDFFEVDRCCQWIKKGQYTRVALQFPDELLPKSTDVATCIKNETLAEVFILADTSYGSCCVDEVAASHYSAQAIIHFGHCCLSPSGRLPVLYIFGKGVIDVTHCCQQLQDNVPVTSRILVVFSVEYEHIRGEVINILSKFYCHVLTPEVVQPGDTSQESQQSHDTSEKPVSDRTQVSQSTSIFEMFSRQFHVPQGVMADYDVVYIGQESMFLTNMMLTFKDSVFYSYNPRDKSCQKLSINTNKLLMKRFYLVEKVKDAKIVGILIATLSVSRYLDIVNRLKTLLNHAGKKYYIFSVGKINVPKLANFPDVDVYVLVSCPESVILDSSEYFCPIVTPYEVELACNPDREWQAKFVLDYSSLLPGGADHQEVDWSKPVDEMDISLITGNVRQLGMSDTESISTTDGTIATRDPMVLTAVAGDRFASKSWQGLDPQLGQTEVGKALQGRKGVAIQYEEEPS